MKVPFLRLLLLAIVTALAARAADLKLGMIGLDTSHVVVYLKLFNDPKNKDYVPGAKIVAAFKGGSADIESSASRVEGYTKTAVEEYGVKLYDSIEEMSKHVDGIIIFSVDGRPHLDQFRRTLAAKKPVFIDKPFAGTLKDAVEMRRLARENNIPCWSSSSLRYSPDQPAKDLAKIGQVTSVYSFGPCELEPHHPDLFWYGIHTVEAMYTVLGRGCVTVTRAHTVNTDIVTGIWSDGRVGVMQGNRAGHKGYGMTVLGTKGKLVGGEKQSYVPLAQAMMAFFQGGPAPVSLDDTVEILAFMEAADESKRRGGAPVSIADVMKAAGAK